MGETFYSFLVMLFTNASNAHLGPDRIVSMGLSSVGIFVAYLWLTASLLWLTSRSVLMRRTTLVYFFAAIFMLCGFNHLSMVIAFPGWLQLALDFATATTALTTAFLMWQRRHFILSAIYQFKYVIGLLKTIERLDEVEKE